MTKRLLCAFGCLLVSSVLPASGFNADHRSYAQMNPDSDAEADSYFGFSVVHHNFPNGLGLVVGAPLDTASDNLKIGAVYRCPMIHQGTCSRIQNIESTEDQYIRNAATVLAGFTIKTGINFTYSNITVDGQLLGYSVFESNGLIGACAPKFIYGPGNTPRARLPDAIGRCVVLEDGYRTDTLPVFQWQRDQSGTPSGNDIYLSGADALILDKENIFVVGEPLGGFSLSSPQDPSGRLMAQSPIANHSMFYETSVTDNSVDSYLGYKIASGYFLSEDVQHVAASSPRDNRHKGNIAFFSSDFSSGQIRRSKPNDPDLVGTETDGYYGYDFAAVKVTRNNYDSLVVGCPLCDRERGRVYFHRNQAGDFQSGVAIQSPLTGGDTGRFGMTVSNIGDIDLDGYEDVAIGAPFANGGKGEVYIYRGTEGGLFPTPSQRLTPPTGSTGHFGYAITGGFDVDNNGYPDFSVTSVSTSSVSPVFLYRSSIKMDVNVTVKEFPSTLNLVNLNCDLSDGTRRVCFNITVCFQLQQVRPEDKVNEFKIHYNVKVDDNFSGDSPRVQVDPLATSSVNYHDFDIKLTLNKLECDSSLFYLKSDVTIFTEDMDVEVTVEDSATPLTYPSSPDGLGGKLHPVLNVSSSAALSLTDSRKINVTVDCGPNNLCEPDYDLSVELRSGNVYLNDQQNITFDVHVHNRALESGLAPLITITHEGNVDRKGETSISPGALAKPSCESIGNTMVTCQLKSPIESSEWVNFTISFSPRTSILPLSTKSLQFDFEVSGKLGESQPRSISKDVPIQAIASYSLEIVSTGGDPLTAFDVYNYESALNSDCSTPLNESVPLASIGPVANMRYVVQNSQPIYQGSTIPESRLTLYWPSRLAQKPGQNLTEACRLLLVPNGIIPGEGIQCNYYGFNLFKDDSRFSEFYSLNPGTGVPPPTDNFCSEGVECDVIQCTIQDLQPGSSPSIIVQSLLWSYSITQNLNLTIWARVENLTSELKAASTQKISVGVNTAVQEFLVQCANEYIPIIAVFIGLVGFFIILLFLAFFGFFGQTTIKRKLKEIQEKKDLQNEPAEVNQDEYDESIIRKDSPPEYVDADVSKPKVLSPLTLETGSRESSIAVGYNSDQQSPVSPSVHYTRTTNISPSREETEL